MKPTAFSFLPRLFFPTSFLFFYLALSFLPLPSAEAAGGWPGYFLYQGAGARGMGLGRAYVALSDDSSSVFWNPAALSRLEQNELSFLHAILFEDTRYDFLGYVHVDQALKPFTFGVGAAQVFSGGFVKRDTSNNITGDFSDQQTAVFFSAGFWPVSQLPLSVGSSVRLLNKQVDTLASTGFCVDVSAFFVPLDFISVGANVQNMIATPLQRGSGTETPPLIVLGGVAANIFDMFVGTCAIEKIGSGGWTIHAGFEYAVMPEFSVRAGMDQGYPTGGVGIRVDQMGFDYAILSHPDLGFSHRAGASLKFGVNRKAAETAERVRAGRITVLWQQGQTAMKQVRWREAVKAYQELLKLDENHEEAKLEISTIKRHLGGVNPTLVALDLQGDLRAAKVIATMNEQWPKEFSKSSEMAVVPASQVETVLKEKGLSNNGCATVECAVEIGALLNVPWVAIGQVSRGDGDFSVTGQIVSVKTGAIMASKTIKYHRGQNTSGITRDLVADLLRQLAE